MYGLKAIRCLTIAACLLILVSTVAPIASAHTASSAGTATVTYQVTQPSADTLTVTMTVRSDDTDQLTVQAPDDATIYNASDFQLASKSNNKYQWTGTDNATFTYSLPKPETRQWWKKRSKGVVDVYSPPRAWGEVYGDVQPEKEDSIEVTAEWRRTETAVAYDGGLVVSREGLTVHSTSLNEQGKSVRIISPKTNNSDVDATLARKQIVKQVRHDTDEWQEIEPKIGNNLTIIRTNLTFGGLTIDFLSPRSSSYSSTLFIDTSLRTSTHFTRETTSHELFHVYQQYWMDAFAFKWFDEGSATYFAYKSLLNNGQISQRQFHNEIDRRNSNASLTGYRQEGVTPPREYYDRGMVVTAALDARIRQRSDGEYGLMDVLIRVERDRTYTLTEFGELVESVTGVTVNPWLEERVKGQPVDPPEDSSLYVYEEDDPIPEATATPINPEERDNSTSTGTSVSAEESSVQLPTLPPFLQPVSIIAFISVTILWSGRFALYILRYIGHGLRGTSHSPPRTSLSYVMGGVLLGCIGLVLLVVIPTEGFVATGRITMNLVEEALQLIGVR